MDAELATEIANVLKPFLGAVHAVNPDGGLDCYPGSPLIARHVMRKQDRLSAVELHPQDVASLRMRFAGDFQTRVIELDGWLALGAHLPPKERRGVVLVDPPFEAPGEFGRLAEGLARAHRRWPEGIYALWYPIKDRMAVESFRAALRETGIPKILDIGLFVRGPSPEPRLDGSGMIVVNPPYILEAEIKLLLPALAAILGEGPGAGFTLDWLAAEMTRP